MQLNFENLYPTEDVPMVSTFDKRLAKAMGVRGLRAVDLCRITQLSKSVISQ